MTQLTLQIPDDLARGLECIAAVQKKSIEQVALERLRSLVSRIGSPEAVLRAMREPPHLSSSAIDDLEAAISSGRVPVREPGHLRYVIEGMIYLLDTNAISDLMKADLRIEKWMAGLNEDDRVVTCTIVRGEILFGIARRRADPEEKSRQLRRPAVLSPSMPRFDKNHRSGSARLDYNGSIPKSIGTRIIVPRTLRSSQ